MIPVAGSIQSTGLCLYGVVRPDVPLRLQRIAIPASRLGLPSWMRIIRVRALQARIAPKLPSAYLAGSVSCSYVRSSSSTRSSPRALQPVWRALQCVTAHDFVQCCCTRIPNNAKGALTSLPTRPCMQRFDDQRGRIPKPSRTAPATVNACPIASACMFTMSR